MRDFRSHVRARRAWLGVAAAAFAVAVGAAPALANVTLTRISTDPFTNSSSQHATEVEPDTYSSGSTIVSAFQQGRFFDGGASDAGFATSTDGGSTWSSGSLPGTTQFSNPTGPYARVSDASVAFDARHGVWMISTLPLIPSGTSVTGGGVIVSRSTDGGLTWGSPVVVNSDTGTDKNWTACDDTPSSPFYGNCYTEWDLNSAGNLIQMSTSTDGGLTWGPKKTTTSGEAGIGGQPVVQPNGTVIVPIDSANESAIGAFRSTDGGNSWTDVTTITTIHHHTDAGGIRSGALPSAEIDAAGNVYVAWSDCIFRSRCSSNKAPNDIVYSKSSDGVNWPFLFRVPIDSTSSTVDHFIPGLAVDKSTSGSTAHLGLTYYYYPTSSCSSSTCQLDVGFISSTNAGSNWNAFTQLAGPMTLSWLANTSQGVMVGDYISTSFNASGQAHGVFAVASAPSGGVFNEAMFTNTTGLSSSASGAAAGVTSMGNVPAGAYVNNANAHLSWH